MRPVSSEKEREISILNSEHGTFSLQQEDERTGRDQRPAENDFETKAFPEQQNRKQYGERHAELVDGGDFGNVAKLQRLEIKQP